MHFSIKITSYLSFSPHALAPLPAPHKDGADARRAPGHPLGGPRRSQPVPRPAGRPRREMPPPPDDVPRPPRPFCCPYGGHTTRRGRPWAPRATRGPGGGALAGGTHPSTCFLCLGPAPVARAGMAIHSPMPFRPPNGPEKKRGTCHDGPHHTMVDVRPVRPCARYWGARTYFYGIWGGGFAAPGRGKLPRTLSLRLFPPFLGPYGGPTAHHGCRSARRASSALWGGGGRSGQPPRPIFIFHYLSVFQSRAPRTELWLSLPN